MSSAFSGVSGNGARPKTGGRAAVDGAVVLEVRQQNAHVRHGAAVAEPAVQGGGVRVACGIGPQQAHAADELLPVALLAQGGDGRHLRATPEAVARPADGGQPLADAEGLVGVAGQGQAAGQPVAGQQHLAEALLVVLGGGAVAAGARDQIAAAHGGVAVVHQVRVVQALQADGRPGHHDALHGGGRRLPLRCPGLRLGLLRLLGRGGRGAEGLNAEHHHDGEDQRRARGQHADAARTARCPAAAAARGPSPAAARPRPRGSAAAPQGLLRPLLDLHRCLVRHAVLQLQSIRFSAPLTAPSVVLTRLQHAQPVLQLLAVLDDGQPRGAVHQVEDLPLLRRKVQQHQRLPAVGQAPAQLHARLPEEAADEFDLREVQRHHHGVRVAEGRCPVPVRGADERALGDGQRQQAVAAVLAHAHLRVPRSSPRGTVRRPRRTARSGRSWSRAGR